jgi:thioredoxin reductase (NADPH)
VAKPIILTVDDDESVSQAITRDLSKQYGRDYGIRRATSGRDALLLLNRLVQQGRPVALIVSDQRMPDMTGVEFLRKARDHAPDAKVALLTAYADIEAAIRSINEIHLDHYFLKPWDPPEEKLFPVLAGLLADWQAENPGDDPELTIVDHRWSDKSHRLKTFLHRNHVPFRWLDLERNAEAQRLRDATQAGVDDLPLVQLRDGRLFRGPSEFELADALAGSRPRLETRATRPLYDLCIVGGGPAGLAAAVYGASEGLQSVVVEREAHGGQAGLSAKIDNYLGFPNGLSGAELTQRATLQATRFGAEMILTRDVCALEARGHVRVVRFADAGEIEARAVVVASGVSYRLLDAPGLAELSGRGVYYGATAADARACASGEVYIVGAANSAGQAAVNMAHHARRVVLLVRGDSLEKSMSHYLVARIHDTPNIDVRLQTEVVAGSGDGHLEQITVHDHARGTKEDVDTNWLFVFIGATPHTEWLGEDVARDGKGFVITGPDLLARTDPPRWPLPRPPFALETTVPGVFAAGDVRLDSMKRVASAVGEGAMAVYMIHRYLATI